MTANVGRGISVSRGLTFVGLVMLLAGLAVAFASPARGGTLDQSQIDVDDDAESRITSFSGQTFTAGLSGGIDRVDVYVRRNPACSGVNGLSVEIASGTVPGQGALARAVVPAASVPTSFGWVSARFPNRAAPVGAGGKYSLRFQAQVVSPSYCQTSSGSLSSASEFSFSWGRTSGDSYPGGSRFVCGFGCASVDGDYAFTTYVVPGPPPPTPGPPPPPPPPADYTRDLTLRYSKSKQMFRGALTSDTGSAACFPTMVQVLKVEESPNPNTLIGSTIVNLRDRYSLEATGVEGRFYARVGQRSVPGGTCLAARSETIKVERGKG